MSPRLKWPALAWPTRSAAHGETIRPVDLREAFLGFHLPFMTAPMDDVILTRDGDLIASVAVTGVNSFTANDSDCDILLRAFASLCSQLGEDFGWYVHKVTIPDPVKLAHMPGDGFASEVDRRWNTYVQGLGLVHREMIVTLCLRPTITQRISFFGKITGRNFRADVANRARKLDEAMRFFSASCGGANVERLTVSSGRWLGLLSTILGRRYGHIKPDQGAFLAGMMTDFNIKFSGDSFVTDDGISERHGAIFSVKSYPAETWSTMLDNLSLPFDLTVTNSFTPIRANQIEGRIKRTARQMKSSEDSAISLQEQLVEAADAVASGRQSFGDHHMTIRIMAETTEELEIGASEIKRVGQEVGAVFVRETFAARAAYFAQCPTNYAYRGRKASISAHNFVAFSALHSSDRGIEGALLPWGSPITAFPVLGSTVHRFSFHMPGKKDAEPTAGHTLVLGVPGTGKSLMAAFLASQARRADVRVIVFDKDRGLEMPIRALGGAYSAIRVGVPTGFNPLRTETGVRGHGWLVDWLSALMRGGETDRMTPQQSRALQDAIGEIVDAGDRLKEFDELVTLLAPTDDDGSLRDRAAEWGTGGRYGWLFADRPEGGGQEINLHADITGIDMTEILDTGLERSALLAYLFRRIEVMVEDRRPTVIILDEAWKLLDDNYFVEKLHDWLVTMRKKNVVVMMLTQTPTHLGDSTVGKIIQETTVTQVFFPNPKARAEDYVPFNLTAKEVDWLISAETPKRTAVIRSPGGSVFAKLDMMSLGGLVTVLGGGGAGDAAAPPNWRSDPDFWRKMC